MDYLEGGSLYDRLIANNQPFPPTVVRYYAGEILLGISNLHRKSFVYRDLKLENILLDGDGHAYITDFGLTHKLTCDENGSLKKVLSFSGTPVYIAPEVLLQQEHDFAVDLWALGIIMFIMLTEEPPFWNENIKAMFTLVIKSEPDWSSYQLPESAVDLLKGLLRKDPKTRFTIQDAQSHRFFHGLDWNALERKRIPAPLADVCRHHQHHHLKSSKSNVDKFCNYFMTNYINCPEEIKEEDLNLFEGFTWL